MEEAFATDELSVNWTGMYAYAFPPPVLLHFVLKKITQESCTVILIAPSAPRQTWYPLLLELYIDYPRKIPNVSKMLTQKRGKVVHPDPESLKLVAWKVSSISQ
jgi:hypothetical protein